MNLNRKIIMPCLMLTFLNLQSCQSKQTGASNPNIVEASQIIADLKAGKNIYIENKTVTGDIDFISLDSRVKEGKGLSRNYITSGLYFFNCVFTGKLIAYKTEKEDITLCNFAKNLSFDECEFKEEVTFRESVIAGNCSFNKCFFINKTSFEGIRFLGDVAFNGANFAEELRFQNVVFYNKCNFMDAVFGKTTYFQGCIFFNDAQMSNTRWYKYADLSVCNFHSGAFFNYAQFDERSVFNNSTFNGRVELLKANFTGNSELKNCLFYGQVKLFDAIVAAAINFSGSTFFLKAPDESAFKKTGNAQIIIEGKSKEKK